MAENKKKIYQIEINGIKESADAVDALIKKLNELEAKIKDLDEKIIKIKVDAPTVSTSSTASYSQGRPVQQTDTTNVAVERPDYASEMEQEVALQKELNKLKKEGETLDAKIAASQTEIYQRVQATKDLYKESIADQKAIGAQERLNADEYSNTMQGYKDKLADIKKVINTTDFGDGAKIKELTTEAKRLNDELSSMEQEYGQFGRNVGNYANGVADGMKQITITVGGVERTFTDARNASRELSNELKSMAINGQQGTKEFKELQKAVAQLNSDMKDATVSSTAMDNMLDTLQGFASIASVGEGISALFGIDNDEIERSIQKLVALQNVMQGIEEIRQQMNTGEGVGGWLEKGNAAIDNFAAKITGAKKAQAELNKVTTEGKTATEGLAKAQTAQATATVGASKATKVLSLALKGIGIGLIVSAVAYLVSNWDELKKSLTDTVPVLKNIGSWFDKIKAVVMGVGSVVINYLVQPFATLVQTIANIINGESIDKIWSDIKNGLKNTFNVAGNFQKGYHKEVERQQEAHNAKVREAQKKANEEELKDAEAKYGQSLSRTKEYLKKQLALTKEGSDERKELQRKLWETERREREENEKKRLASVKKGNKELSDAERDLINLRISNMKEGLNKTLTQLEEERKAKLAKVVSDGKLINERSLEINKLYDRKVEDAKREHAENIKKIYDDMWSNILQRQIENQQKLVENSRQREELEENVFKPRTESKLFGQEIISYARNEYTAKMPSAKKQYDISDEMAEDAKKLIELSRELDTISKIRDKTIIESTSVEAEEIEKLTEIRERYKEELESLSKENIAISDEEFNEKKKKLDEEYKLYQKTPEIIESYNNELNKLLNERKAIFSSEDEYKEYIEELKKYQKEEEDSITEHYSKIKSENTKYSNVIEDGYKKRHEEYSNYLNKMNEKYSSEDEKLKFYISKQALTEDNYSTSLSQIFNQRIATVDSYWAERLSIVTSDAERVYKQEIELLKSKTKQEKDIENKAWGEQQSLQSDWYKKERERISAQAENEKWSKEELNAALINTEKTYKKAAEELLKTHKDNLRNIERQYNIDELTITDNKNKKIKAANEKYYQETLQEFRDFQTALNNLESKQPVRNVWGFTNWKETDKNNKELLQSYENLGRELILKRLDLNQKYKDGLIDKNVYESSIREIDSFEANLGEKMSKVKEDLSLNKKIEEFAKEAQGYIQELANTLTTILDAVWNAQDVAFDKEQEALDKENEMLQEKLQEQENMINDHKSKVDDIEDELKTARGDRRQQLIDNLNAEMAAERAALAEKQRLQKQEEKNKEAQDKLDKKRKEAEYKRSIIQAVVNGAMAVTMAAINKWPVPAIPMMALAASTTAAQIAIMKANKPYAKGGQLEGGKVIGARHRDGGVKVLGGRAEIEGGEYITNRLTTAKNIDVLEYINGKHKKLSLDDFIDFYGSSSVKKNVASLSPRAKFADGGILPTIDNEYTFDDRLLSAFEDYSNRPVVVAVKDINDRQANVRNVQVLAGLTD